LHQQSKGYQSYEVINAGVPGWVSDQITMRVRTQLAAYKPDAVILYVGWNDFQAFDPTTEPPKMSAFEAMYGGAIWKQYATGTLRSVALLSAVYEQVHTRRPANRENVSSGHAPPQVQYRFLLANLNDIVQEFRRSNPDVQMFVCTLVGLWPQGDLKHWEKIKGTVPWWITADKLTPPDAARYVAELNGVLKEFTRARNLSLIDLAAAFENLDRQRLQFDWAHMYPDGYELMAWNMLNALYQAGILHGQQDSRFSQLVSKYQLSAAAREGGTRGR
ncbi:MAG TPA: SGNH/GDSL hydrolase family protein, partial [Blastocatellia bacterium]|nr:SGNH/GDSL hydrolase family protein [Blastocatellia bacterium]